VLPLSVHERTTELGIVDIRAGIDALRLYAEGCEALVAVRAAPRPQMQWRQQTVMKADLFDDALEWCREALHIGFFDLTNSDLITLGRITLPLDLQPYRAAFLAHCFRQDDAFDEFGHPLPASIYDCCVAIEQAVPYGLQGHSSVVKKILIDKLPYFAKLTDETLSGSPPGGSEDRDAVACYAALRVLFGTWICPQESYFIRTASGSYCTLMRATPGRTYLTPETALRHAGPDIATQVQQVVLAEWLLGILDRHHRNLLISKRGPAIIDAVPCWRFNTQFLGWTYLGKQRHCHSFAREIWEYLDPDLYFASWIISQALVAQPMVLATLQRYQVGYDILQQVRMQFIRLAAADGEKVALVDIERKANI
jgi:hypothetical protein